MDYNCHISNDFNLAVQSSQSFDSFGIMYIIAGVSPKNLCNNCPGQHYAFGDKCIRACPLGTNMKKYQDGGFACSGSAVSGSASTSTQTTTQTTSTTSQSGYAASSHSQHTSSQSQQASSQSQQASSQSQQSQTSQQSSPAVTMTSTQQTSQQATQQSTPQVVSTSSQQSTPQVTSTSSQQSTASSSQAPAPTKIECPKNSFFNGFECACEVGYGYINGACVALNINQPIPIIIKSKGTQPTQPTHTSTTQTSSTQTTSTQTSSTQTTSTQTSSTQTTSTQTTPVRPQNTSPVTCPSNSYDNGLGTCVC